MMKSLLTYLALIVAAFSVQSQNASALLERNEIKIGEQTTIQLALRVPAAQKNILMPALQDTITKFVELVHLSEIDTTFDDEDITTKIFSQTITITSWDSGIHVIPPFKFVLANDTLKTTPLLLTVNTIPIQAEQDIKDIKSIMEVPFSLTDWLLAHKKSIGLILLAVILIVVGIILYRKYKHRPKAEEEDFVPKEAADIVANRKLLELENNKLWQNGKIKEYYSKLSFIIREYIENRFQLRALELTTDEISNLIQALNEVEKSEKEKLHEILLLADMAKFAKQQPIAIENEDSLKNTYRFIEKTALKAETVNEEDDENQSELLSPKNDSENA